MSGFHDESAWHVRQLTAIFEDSSVNSKRVSSPSTLQTEEIIIVQQSICLFVYRTRRRDRTMPVIGRVGSAWPGHGKHFGRRSYVYVALHIFRVVKHH